MLVTDTVGTLMMGSYQVGTLMLGSYQVGTLMMGSYQVDTLNVGSYQVGTLMMGSYQVIIVKDWQWAIVGTISNQTLSILNEDILYRREIYGV